MNRFAPTVLSLVGFAMGLPCAGCGRQAAVPSPSAPPAAQMAAAASADPDAQCKSWGIEPDSPGYKQCVDGMREAANAEAGSPQSAEQAGAELTNMRAGMVRRGDDMRKQVIDEMKAAASNPKCVTITNGSNTSVSCP